MAQTTITSTATLSLSSVIAMRVIDAAYSATVCRPLVRNESLESSASDVMDFPAWPALTALAVAENADITPTAITTTEVSISTSEVGLSAEITDAASEDDILSGLEQYSRQLGLALADKMDADIAALFSGFSNVNGDVTNGLSQEDILTGIRNLDSRDAPKDHKGVFHPVQWAQLGLDVVTNGGSVWGGDSPQDSRFGNRPPNAGMLFNVPIWQTTNTPTNTRTNPVYDGAVFSSEAIGFVVSREARVELDRDASKRSTEIVVTARYGTGELVDDYGQCVYSNQTA